ncbi:MAG: SNF2-related protein [bacterium]
MAFKLTQVAIQNWGGPAVFKEAEELVKRGGVLRADYQPPWLEGEVARGTGELRARARISDSGILENRCPCYASRDQGLVCSHTVALALTVLRRTSDPLREQKYQEEQRRARRLASLQPADYLRCAPDGTPAALLVTIPGTWQADFARNEVSVGCALAIDGRIIPLDQVPRDRTYCLPPADENLLTVLDDICDGPAAGRVAVRPPDFLNVLELRRNAAILVAGGGEIAVNSTPMRTLVRIDLDRENGELLVNAHTELPFLRPGEFPAYVVSGRKGWALGANQLWPLENLLPLPYHGIYQAPIVIARPDVMRFLTVELPVLEKAVPMEAEIAPDFFTASPGTPTFRLLARGSPASLAADLLAVYGAKHEVAAGGPDKGGAISVPDPDDILHYFSRNTPAEERALARLAEAGFRGTDGATLDPLTGTREVLNFLGSQVPALRRLGWKVALEGKVAGFHENLPVATPVVHVTSPGGSGWFDVGFEFESPVGGKLKDGDVQRALRLGNAYVERDGQTVLIDRDAIESMHGVFSDCSSREGSQSGHFRLPAIYAPYVRSSLAALDGVDVEEPPDWRERAARQNRELRLEPVALGDPLEGILRPYQKEGVYWLRFLERGGACGLLADEMGLGKTIQTLAWLQLARVDPEARDKPALIVCPTSLVENWAREAQQFTPWLKVLVLSGNRRHELWDEIPASHLVITSYALLRRDIERYVACAFGVAVLDEAQHIKNRSTQNAVAVKQLRAHHKVVLTGTPVENGVADIWSIMDFLMPGYLGDYELFRGQYEQPIVAGDRDGEIAQTKLRRKLHPFLLRRLKRDVAKDLPDKLTKTSFCSLTPDQQRVYNEILQESRRRVGDLVAAKGFARCHMEILAILMKLRQVCCHLELLKLPELAKTDGPSAKLEQFFEILDEAMDGGHRVLVFSQFVSMLQIIRREMESRSLAYCYLDGQSKDRMAQVQQFNQQHNIPAFLISLKAGGTGLNLTGADMVVHFDPWWNPAVEDQATDRAHRIGQKRTVYSIKLIAQHTVEEKVLALQKRKQAIIGATISSADESILKALSWDDVRDLLGV